MSIATVLRKPLVDPENIPDLLKTDCNACAALCCVHSGFSAGDDFAIDKPAGKSCPNLTGNNGCSIHTILKQKGFTGCVVFDCNGAGPWLLQAIKATHRQPADINMIDAFRAARDIRRALELIYTAGSLNLNEAHKTRRHRLLTDLTPDIANALDLIMNYENNALPAKIDAFLKSLREIVKTDISPR